MTKFEENEKTFFDLMAQVEELTKNHAFTPEQYIEQQINFAVGNCFDVFPTKNVITSEVVKAAMNKHLGANVY
jgi:hypothetical protein